MRWLLSLATELVSRPQPRSGGRLRIVSVQQSMFAVLLSGSYSLWQSPTHVNSPPLTWGAHVSGKKFPIRAPVVRGAATPGNKAARAAAVHSAGTWRARTVARCLPNIWSSAQHNRRNELCSSQNTDSPSIFVDAAQVI